METTEIGPYRIEPKVKASTRTTRPRKDDLFYRLMRDGEMISDHGDLEGATYAAEKLRKEADPTAPEPKLPWWVVR